MRDCGVAILLAVLFRGFRYEAQGFGETVESFFGHVAPCFVRFNGFNLKNRLAFIIHTFTRKAPWAIDDFVDKIQACWSLQHCRRKAECWVQFGAKLFILCVCVSRPYHMSYEGS